MTRKQPFNPQQYQDYFTKGKDAMIVKLVDVRLAFPNLFTAQSVNGGAAKYNANFILDPSDKKHKATIRELESAMEEVAIAKWGDKKGRTILETLKKKDRVCFRDGSDKEKYAGFEGMMYVSASNDTKPLVIDRNRNELSAKDGKPYSGCYVVTSVEIWAQDNQYGQRINASLRGVQFSKDGDAFAGGAPASADEFDDLSDGSDEDDDDDIA